MKYVKGDKGKIGINENLKLKYIIIFTSTFQICHLLPFPKQTNKKKLWFTGSTPKLYFFFVEFLSFFESR